MAKTKICPSCGTSSQRKVMEKDFTKKKASVRLSKNNNKVNPALLKRKKIG